METLAVRNKNPGNLRDTQTGSFRSFNDPVEGKAALYNDLTAKITGTSKTGLNGESSLLEFAKTYAPASDKNDPVQYAANLANKLGVSPDEKIGNLSSRIDDFALAVASNEDPSVQYKPQNKTQSNNLTQDPIIDGATADQPQKEHTIAGNIIRGAVKPFAKLATSGVNLIQDIAGSPETQPFSGGYLGEVNRIGSSFDLNKPMFSKENVKAVGDALGTGTEIGLMTEGGGILKNLIKGTPILRSPMFLKASKLSLNELRTLPRETVANRIKYELGRIPVTEIGGKKEQILLQALSKLYPVMKKTLLQKSKGILGNLIKGVGSTAVGIGIGAGGKGIYDKLIK